jgi:hypothetical protein
MALPDICVRKQPAGDTHIPVSIHADKDVRSSYSSGQKCPEQQENFKLLVNPCLKPGTEILRTKKPSPESGEGWVGSQYHFKMLNITLTEHLPYFFKPMAGIEIHSGYLRVQVNGFAGM